MENKKPETIVTYDQNGNRIEIKPPVDVMKFKEEANIKGENVRDGIVQAGAPVPVQKINLDLKPKLYQKYEIKPDSYFYVKFGLKFLKDEMDENLERLVVVEYDKINKEIDNFWMKFRMWTFMEEQEWKNTCTEQNKNGDYLINRIKLNELKVRHLLLEWSFEENKLIHINKYLVDESHKDFLTLHPNILKYTYSQLDAILENNE